VDKRKVSFMLDGKQKSSCHFEHAQAALSQTRPNPRHALRGVVHAVDLPRGGVSINTVMSFEDIAGLIETAAQKPERPKTRKKRLQIAN
jgi:hypothetical protein